MTLSNSLVRSLALTSALALATLAHAQDSSSDTLSLDEVKMAAAAKFDKLDTDHDGRLEPAEVKGLITDKAFKLADTDADGSLSKDEYAALVEKRFKSADVDHDGSVSTKELNGPNGHALKRLIR